MPLPWAGFFGRAWGSVKAKARQVRQACGNTVKRSGHLAVSTWNALKLLRPFRAQILTALAAAALSAALIVVGTLLTRHQAWVRRAQIVVLVMAVLMAAGAFAVDQLTAHAGLDVGGLLGVATISLIDLDAVFAMTGPRIVAWFGQPGSVPIYVSGLVAFWAATMVAFVTVRAV